MICPKCHTVNDDEEKYCKNCGFQLNSARICPECGKTNDSNSKYCKECGAVLTPVNTFRKQVIDESTKKSFFSMYKVPLICALVILLAIGAVTGMAYYNNGNSGGDDGSNSIIPLDNNYTGFFEDDATDAQMQENDTNKTNDTNASNTLTEKVNKTNKTKTITDNVNKTKQSNNSSKSMNSSSSKNNSSKSNTEKANNKGKSDKSQDKKDKKISPDKNDSVIPDVIPDISDNDTNDSQSDSSIDEINDTNSTNDTSEDDILNSSVITEIEMEDVPNLAKEVSERNYAFSTIEFEGNEFTKAQCIDIFSQYLLNIDNDSSSPIEIKDVKNASNPSGEDLSQTVEKSDYLSIADRVHSWIDSKDTVPNYVGISTVGADDLSDDKMLELFTLAILDYSITGELPESVEI